MSDPDVVVRESTTTPAAGGGGESDLKLSGDKIKLVSRPVSKETTASSRCALLGRPLSAVPTLNLYRKDDFETHVNTKRPFSADDSPYATKQKLKHLDLLSDLQDVEDKEDLPSSELLKNLIAEPISNWKPSEFFLCELTPGLKSKPPLPKKPPPKIEDEIEEIRLKSLQFDDEFPKKYHPSNKFFQQEMISEKEFNSHLQGGGEGEGYNVFFEDLKSATSTFMLQEPPGGLELDELDEDQPNLKRNFKNWVSEDTFACDDVGESEKRTDSYFKNLKSQHEEIDKCIEKAQKVLDKTKKHPDAPPKDDELLQDYKFQKFFDPSTAADFKKAPVTARNSEKAAAKAHRKPTLKKTNAKIASAIDGASKPKSKFTPKAMKSYRDYPEKGSKEEESWMGKEDAHARARDLGENPKPKSYLDFLNNVDDLEQVTKALNEHDVVEVDANTYDDIVQILQVLEEEDKKSQETMATIKELVDKELTKELPHSKSTESLRSSSASDQEKTSTISLASTTSNNYNEILSFLDEVDRNCTKSLVCAKERVHKVTQFLEKAICLDSIPKKEDLQVLTNDELSEQIVTLNLRLKEKSSSIRLLQGELSTLREQVVKNSKQTEEVVKQKLKQQKEDHEAVVKRHQKFIDQLIADKKVLNQQCEGLINELKLLEDRYKSNVKAAEHRHQVELQKVKEMHVAGEKIRRERWMDAKTQKIKELTVKSIEPELQSMTVRHQQEISDLRALHKKELEDLELKAARKTQQQCEALRMQMAEEREKALAHEREIMRLRYEKLVECEEKGYQEQRRRLLQDHANRLAECEEREAAATSEKERLFKQAQDEFDDKLQAINRRHNSEIKMLRETAELEMEAWKNNFRKQQAVEMLQKETQMREHFKRDRDREIEAVIERLEAESNEMKSQLEQATENRMKRMKEKFDDEIRDLEQSEKDAKKKYSETRSQLLEAEDAMIALRSTVKQLESQLKEYHEVANKMSVEKEQMKSVVREELRTEIDVLEKEIAQLRNEKDKELQQVYSRVKMAVARKDEVLSELTRDHAALQEKCVYLENMLEQQRKEYLIK